MLLNSKREAKISMSVMQKSSFGEKYPWFFLDLSSAWAVTFLFTLAMVGLSIVLFVAYGHLSNDPTPDSLAGYAYAIAGTFFMLLAALGYSRHRRSRERGVGQLNGSLHWHISFGIIAIVLLFLHSFGNFNPRTGTYALYGMIALVISGIVGRFLDRVLPKLTAHAVRRALTEQGEDRVDLHTRTIESIVSYNKQELHSLKPQKRATRSATNETKKPLTTTWDLAYISLEETPQEVKQNEAHYRFVPDRQSELDKPETLMPGVRKHLEELHNAQNALQREEYYRAIIRYWRVGHVALAFLTVGLTLWHLEYAATLLMPMFLK
jgi:hypothetical protein